MAEATEQLSKRVEDAMKLTEGMSAIELSSYAKTGGCPVHTASGPRRWVRVGPAGGYTGWEDDRKAVREI